MAQTLVTDMVISVKETTVFSVFHPDAHDLFNTCSDLKKVAWELWDPKRRLNDAVSTCLVWQPDRSELPAFRIKLFNSSVLSPLCCANDRHDGSKSQSRKCKAASSSLRRNSMESACNYTNAGTSTSTALGTLARASKEELSFTAMTGRGKTTLTSTALMLALEV